jgi:hypothetical protein
LTLKIKAQVVLFGHLLQIPSLALPISLDEADGIRAEEGCGLSTADLSVNDYEVKLVTKLAILSGLQG